MDASNKVWPPIIAAPFYTSHKVVQAWPVTGIEFEMGSTTVTLQSEYGPFLFSKHNAAKSNAVTEYEVGGYIVRYSDGYISYSPKIAFEEGYTPRPEIGAQAREVLRQAGELPAADLHTKYDSLKAADDYAAQGATAPRVTLADMKAKIEREIYFTAGQADGAVNRCFSTNNPLDRLTFCILVISNGFTVVGKSAPASAENFDAEKGKKFAYDDAINQLWPLEGYALRERLSAAA